MQESERIDRYEALLLKWGAKVNLIGPEARRSLREHIDEALLAAEILAPEGEVLDFGSGGGLPAIPMAIVSPMARFHMVEADQRKWAFLKAAVRECALNSVVHGDRLTALLPKLEKDLRFSLITSRAVGEPEQWVPLVAPFLSEGGRVALFTRATENPLIDGFVEESRNPLPRGEANVLLILRRG